jgi:hypothetical protein
VPCAHGRRERNALPPHRPISPPGARLRRARRSRPR